MQAVSVQYQNGMKEPFRNRATMLVAFGDVAPEAQTSSVISSIDDMAYFSKTENVFNGGDDSFIYATLEHDFYKCDGTMYLLPTEEEIDIVEDTGITGEAIGSLSFDVDLYSYTNEIERLQFFFGEHYPTLIQIHITGTVPNGSYWEKDFTIYNNQSIALLNTQTFAGASHMRVSLSGLNGYRVRIYSILYGSGRLVTADRMEKTELSYHSSKINETLPQVDFTMVIKDYGHRYDVENPNNPLSFLDNQNQVMNIYYGYDVDGEENYEWLHGGTVYSKDWIGSEHTATVNATDILRDLDILFLHNNADLMANANAEYWIKACLSSMGFESYTLDADLADIPMTLPLRTYPCKETLQLLANYCCKSLMYDREGNIRISNKVNNPIQATELNYEEFTANDYVTQLTTETVEIVADEETEEIPETFSITVNPSASADYLRADITFVSDEDITQTDSIIVEDFTIPYTFEIETLFGEGTYTVVISEVRNYEGTQKSYTGVVGTNYTYMEVVVERTPIDGGAKTVNSFIISPIVSPYNVSVYIDKSGYYEITVTAIDDSELFVLEKDDIYDKIDTTKGELVKEIVVPYYSYTIAEGQEELHNETINVDVSEGTVTHEIHYDFGDTMYSEITVYRKDTIGGVSTQTSFTVEATDNLNLALTYFENCTSEIIITASGRYNAISSTVTIPVNDNGKTITWDNPLVGTVERATAIGEFVADYYRSNVSYNYSYRGNPELDVNDIIIQQNDFVEDMKVVITESKLSFNGAFRGELTTRRQ